MRSFGAIWVGFGIAVFWRQAAGAEEMKVPGGIVSVGISGKPSPALQATVQKWVDDSARAVAAYLGAFPVRRARVEITLGSGHEPSGGHAYGWDGPHVQVDLGRDAKPADLLNDWILTHECLHLGFPSLLERHHWLEEGMAVYCESIARMRAGLIPPEQAWNDLREGLPQGQPEAGDKGLDHTATWGRTYWGGALFCFRADVEIRKRTGNRYGLEHALRAIVKAGGTIEHTWPIERVINTGDTATGVPVLRELYKEMKDRPVRVDLDALWRDLGVITSGKTVRLDDEAPLAATRRAIQNGR